MNEDVTINPAQWFVAKTQPNGEIKAQYHLKRQGFDVYLPQSFKTNKPRTSDILAA